MLTNALANPAPNESAETHSQSEKDWLSKRTAELFAIERKRDCAEIDRLFMWLMVLQWIAAIVIAVVVSPTTWIGETSYLHVHVPIAVVFGGIISIPPIFMAIMYPGDSRTRLTVAIAQGAWSCLLIHLTGGRLETHFHAFGSLAFLASYRQWRLLIVTCVIITLDHIIRGSLWPISVYGVAVDSTYRFLEHAAWLTWINVFLIRSCIHQFSDSLRASERQAKLEHTNLVIEERIQQRTQQLALANRDLEREFEEHQKTQQQREQAFSDLALASRKAGMAEVATGVLHNVGNVLNSVNVSTNLLTANNRQSRISRLVQATEIIQKHKSDLGTFITEDKQGKHFPAMLRQLTEALVEEQEERTEELLALSNNLEHICEVVSFQQSYATEKVVLEQIEICELVEDALKINTVKKFGNQFKVVREFAARPTVNVDKHKVLQVLINLVSNARHSLVDSGRSDGVMTVSVEESEEKVFVHIEDNGVGIAPEDASRIFEHGFTTKESGHGFGLHSSALAAQTMGGSLTMHSAGSGKGAKFTITFPVKKAELCKI